ncbi:MAG: CinA family protein [Kiritimatiellae bacterium]|nr:CinA family protein [Kiritimatiellia bacterium]MDD5522145.1 CinA family protein [Kiritimatiellia bacterium]
MAKRLKIENKVGQLLLDQGLTLAVAESCTGGLVGHRITSVAGSSKYFTGGVIAYSNEVKIRELGVQRDVLSRYGAVSRPVARQMALGLRRRFGVDIAVAVTGIAGPGGGSAAKPVGLVFIAVAGGGGKNLVRRFEFKGRRIAIKNTSSQAALELLRDFLK